jgi:hypothetical protein
MGSNRLMKLGMLKRKPISGLQLQKAAIRGLIQAVEVPCEELEHINVNMAQLKACDWLSPPPQVPRCVSPKVDDVLLLTFVTPFCDSFVIFLCGSGPLPLF